MNRWLRLGAAVIAMVMIGNLQYAWTLFVQPMMTGTGWKLSEVQWGFTIFVAMMTWTMPLSGWLIDRLLGISPWGFIVFLLLGFVAGVLNVMRTAGVAPGPTPGGDASGGRE